MRVTGSHLILELVTAFNIFCYLYIKGFLEIILLLVPNTSQALSIHDHRIHGPSCIGETSALVPFSYANERKVGDIKSERFITP